MLFLYVMQSGEDLVHVGTSSCPPKRVEEHNTLDDNGKSRVRKTAKGAPNWTLQVVMGPFERHGVNQLAQAIRKERTRKLNVYRVCMRVAQRFEGTQTKVFFGDKAQSQTEIPERALKLYQALDTRLNKLKIFI